jgi:hypothetical protein
MKQHEPYFLGDRIIVNGVEALVTLGVAKGWWLDLGMPCLSEYTIQVRPLSAHQSIGTRGCGMSANVKIINNGEPVVTEDWVFPKLYNTTIQL